MWSASVRFVPVLVAGALAFTATFADDSTASYNRLERSWPLVGPYVSQANLDNVLNALANIDHAEADRVRSQVQGQQAVRMQHENLRRIPETRKQLYEHLRWERDFKIKLSDEAREIARRKRVQAAEEPPPQFESLVRDGSALNVLLDHLARHPVPKERSTAIPAGILKDVHINVLGGSASLLRKDRLSWPLLLQEERFRDDREDIERLLVKARADARMAEGKLDTIKPLFEAVDRLEGSLVRYFKANSGDSWVWRGYLPALRHVKELQENLKMLEQSETVARILGKPLEARTVCELIGLMHDNGYRFAPASLTGGDGVRSYRLLHQAMAKDSRLARDRPLSP